MGNCLFCQIIKGDIPSYKVWDDDKVLAFLDIFPSTLGHTLIIPKVHSDNYLDLSPELWSYMGEVVKKIAKAHMALGAEGTNLFVTQGDSAGQTVFHTHWHCVPRKKGDNVQLGVSGKAEASQILKTYQEKIILELEKISNS